MNSKNEHKKTKARRSKKTTESAVHLCYETKSKHIQSLSRHFVSCGLVKVASAVHASRE